MKFLQAAAFAVILTVTGSPTLRAQEPDEKEKARRQEEEKKKQAPPAKEKTQPKSDERNKAEADKDRTRQETDKRTQPRKEDDQRTRGNQDRQASETDRNEREQQHGGRSNARRIPEESFRVSFGREHHFRVARRDDRRFEYGRYAFEYVDSWPSGWSYDDDCFIEQDGDDYYLVNLGHPELRVLVVIVG